jgi:hypothetical protein
MSKGHNRHWSAPALMWMWICAALCLPTFLTAADHSAPLPADPKELVRAAVTNELKARPPEVRFAFRLRKQTPNGSSLKEIAETNEGMVSYLLEVNDQPLTPEQRDGEARRLANLVAKPEEIKKRAQDEKRDQERVERMVRSLPDALLYEYDNGASADAENFVRLRFKPNPDFDAPNRESQVLKGLAGSMWIEPREQRIVRLDGELVQDVNFGWGLFGKLYKGGKVRIEQSRVTGSDWATVATKLDLNGRILIFKKIRVQQQEAASTFRRIPANLTYAQGAEFLRRQGTTSKVASSDTGH